MKKLSLTALFLLIMLASLVGPAAAAPLSSGSVTLLSVEYVPGKGPVFTFNVSGHFSRSDLKGFVHVEGGADFDLSCTQVDESTVKCTTSKKVGGTNAAIIWGGSTFWTSVPGAPEFCYGVYDWDLGFPPSEWVNYGTYCQETQAQYGDFIVWDNPSWGTWPYEFLPESPDSCSFYHSGNAYYFPACIE